MGNERLGALAEVVFHIEEGSFYNCVMPGTEVVFHIEEGSFYNCVTPGTEVVFHIEEGFFQLRHARYRGRLSY
jgi:hypothetical protein